MSSENGRFEKGQSGNPGGRPKKRRPHVSAFDIIFDKTLKVTQNGKERELTIDEALQLQTYQAALKGSKMAVRKVLKMIEKREAALAKKQPQRAPVRVVHEYDSDNVRNALQILRIVEHDPKWGDEERDQTLRVANWAAQAALSRPGRRSLKKEDVDEITSFTLDGANLRWPRGSLA